MAIKLAVSLVICYLLWSLLAAKEKPSGEDKDAVEQENGEPAKTSTDTAGDDKEDQTEKGELKQLCTLK